MRKEAYPVGYVAVPPESDNPRLRAPTNISIYMEPFTEIHTYALCVFNWGMSFFP